MHSSADLAPLAPGTRLGNYEIVRILRLGGMGELYLARRAGIEGFEKQVALKRILAQFASDPTFENMLLDEARLMATLEHPNIVQVFDIDRVRGSTFFAMEYVQGENLRGVLKEAARQKKGLSRGNALWVVMNVAAGLHYAHEKRRPDGTHVAMIHRDVSPNNIMLSRAGGVKLVDFGIAMAIARSAKTTPGAIKGNIRYMSPEQSVGQPLDRRSDIFSLGIVLFELTTGTRWIREADDYLAVQKMLNEPLPRPTDRRPDYPLALEGIVMRALERNPADRFATAEEFQVALEEFIRENKVAASSVTMARTMAELFPADEALQMARPPMTEPMEDRARASKTLPIPNPTRSQAQLGLGQTLLVPNPDRSFAVEDATTSLPLREPSERAGGRGELPREQTLQLGIVPAGARVDERLPLPEPKPETAPTPIALAGVSRFPPPLLVVLGVSVLAAFGVWLWLTAGFGSDTDAEAPAMPSAQGTTGASTEGVAQ